MRAESYKTSECHWSSMILSGRHQVTMEGDNTTNDTSQNSVMCHILAKVAPTLSHNESVLPSHHGFWRREKCPHGHGKHQEYKYLKGGFSIQR